MPTSKDFWNAPLTAPWTEVPLLRDARGLEWEQGAAARNPLRVRERLERAVDHWIDRARDIPHLSTLGPPLPKPRVRYDLKGGIAGMAATIVRPGALPEQWIRIHPDLLARYPVRMIQQTIPHEIAHLVIDWYLPKVREPHGPEWMGVMIWFGRPPLAFHDMEAAPSRRSSGAAGTAPLLFEAPHGRR
jgi:hypothetical protein